jgi:hypothetical protein
MGHGAWGMGHGAWGMRHHDIHPLAASLVVTGETRQACRVSHSVMSCRLPSPSISGYRIVLAVAPPVPPPSPLLPAVRPLSVPPSQGKVPGLMISDLMLSCSHALMLSLSGPSLPLCGGWMLNACMHEGRRSIIHASSPLLGLRAAGWRRWDSGEGGSEEGREAGESGRADGGQAGRRTASQRHRVTELVNSTD